MRRPRNYAPRLAGDLVTATDPLPSPATSRSRQTMLGLCTAVLIGWALYAAQSVFAPLAFALFIIALVWPLQRSLQRDVPQLLALALTLAMTILVVIVFSSLVTWAVTRITRFITTDAARLQEFYSSVVLWLESHGVVLAELWAEHINGARLVRLAQEITTRLSTVASFSIVVFIYVLLGLLEVDDVCQKLRNKRLGALGSTLLAGGAQTAVKLRQYMLVPVAHERHDRTAGMGIRRLSGLPLASEWGVLAFALNYIPFIGPFIATVFPTLFAMAQFGSCADGRPDFRLPEHHPVRRWQLHRAEIGGPLLIYLSFCRSVRGVLLDLPVGSARRLHRRPDRDRDHQPM